MIVEKIIVVLMVNNGDGLNCHKKYFLMINILVMI